MISGGGSLSDCPALASSDGKQILLANCQSVGIYSSATGQRIQQLQGHRARILGIALHPVNEHQVYTASEDGTLNLWDIAEGLLVSTVHIGQPLYWLVAPKGQWRLLFELQKEEKEKGKAPAAVVRSYDTNAKQLEQPTYALNRLAPLAASSDGVLVGVADTRKVVLWHVKKGWKAPLKLYHTKTLTCLAIASGEDQVAAGDETGRILIWYGARSELLAMQAGREAKPLSCTTVHWHAHAVACLSFSLDAVHLLSGGQEAVLVVWETGAHAKRFLPRLSGQLKSICPLATEPSKYIITQEDNTVRIVNIASMRVELSVHGIRRQSKEVQHQAVHQLAAAMLPGGGELVIAGDNAVIQFYDALRDRHLDKIQVAPRNVTSMTEVEQKAFGGVHGPANEPQVLFITLNGSGDSMATVDIHPNAGPECSSSVSLKFWERRLTGAAGSQLYKAHTQIDGPHRGRVTGLAHHPSERIAASVSHDGELRIWKQDSKLTVAPAEDNSWRCHSVASYQGSTMHSVAFSADGSLVATGSGNSVALWDPHTAALVATLAAPAAYHKAEFWQLVFVPGTPFLAGAARGTPEGLVVWSILTRAVWWWAPISVTALAADGRGTGDIAVGIKPTPGFHQQGHSAAGSVAVLEAASMQPKQVWYLPRSLVSHLFFPPPSSPLFAESLTLTPENTSPLLMMLDDRRYAIGRKHCQPQLSPDVMTNARQETPSVATYNLLSRVLGSAPASPTPVDGEQLANDQTTRLFDAPTHALPLLTSLAPGFLKCLVCQEPSS